MGDFGGKKRSELPDSVFGIPQERKYPMPDELKKKFNLGLSEMDIKYLFDPVIYNMSKYIKHSIAKDLDKKIIEQCREGDVKP